MNPYLTDFSHMLSTRYPVDGKDMTTSEWLEKNTHDPRNPGRKFSFEGYEFQRQIVDDLSRDMCATKPSQVGLTEIQVRKTGAFAVRNRGSSLIFSLPNEKMYKRVSKTRVKPLFQREKVFQSSIGEKPSQSMDLFEVNGSFIYFTGMTEGDATSIPADFLLHDEVDLSDQATIGLYQSRLQNSSWKITQKFSTPTHPGFGIDAAYKVSDQMEYVIKCQCCGFHQIPTFTMKHCHLAGYVGSEDLTTIDAESIQTIDFSESFIKCEHCGRALDILNPELREWVPRHPGRRARGYRVRPFCTASLSLEYVIEQLVKMRVLDQMKGWHNTVLGEPYSDGTNQLGEDVIKKCMKGAAAPEVGALVPFAIGIDVGKVCHITGGPVGAAGAVHPTLFEIVPSEDIVDRVKQLRERYNIVCGAMDRFPYTPTANEVYEVSNRKIIPTEYRGSQLVRLVEDEFKELSHAQVNRTMVIDRVVKLVQRRAIDISGYGQYGEILIAHMCDMVRIEAEEVEARWEKLTGQDHFMHSLALLEISPRIKDVRVAHATDETRSLFGFIGTTGGDKPMIEPSLPGHRARAPAEGLF